MPTYVYRCSNCGHQFDLRQGFDAPVEHECLVCAGPARRLFHSVAVIYRGSGFYTTDYKRSNHQPASDAQAEAGATTHQEEQKAPAPSEAQ